MSAYSGLAARLTWAETWARKVSESRSPPGVGDEGVLQQVVQAVKAGVAAKVVPQHLHPFRGEPFARGQVLGTRRHVRA